MTSVDDEYKLHIYIENILYYNSIDKGQKWIGNITKRYQTQY